MIKEHLKWSAKIVLWHFIAQLACAAIGILVFGLLTLSFRWIEIFVSVSLSIGYVVYMYSKVYKVGERDTKSYVKVEPYPCKGIVLYIPLLVVSLIMVILYVAAADALTLIPLLGKWLTAPFWGYCFHAFFYGPNGSISVLFWILYFAVPFVSCAFGYFSGMHRWEIGYNFFKKLVFRKK